MSDYLTNLAADVADLVRSGRTNDATSKLQAELDAVWDEAFGEGLCEGSMEVSA